MVDQARRMKDCSLFDKWRHEHGGNPHSQLGESEALFVLTEGGGKCGWRIAMVKKATMLVVDDDQKCSVPVLPRAHCLIGLLNEIFTEADVTLSQRDASRHAAIKRLLRYRRRFALLRAIRVQ
jgi:hypothetical protein